MYNLFITRKEHIKMINTIILTNSSSGSNFMLIISYIIIPLLILAIPTGFIFLIYSLIKKLIKYYKTGE